MKQHAELIVPTMLICIFPFENELKSECLTPPRCVDVDVATECSCLAFVGSVFKRSSTKIDKAFVEVDFHD